jgi:micrococcal nuclease
MSRRLVAAAIVVLASASLTACHRTEPFVADCSVTDGDTVKCELVEGKVRIRFNGIDAPELGTPEGEEARLYLMQQLDRFGHELRIVPLKQDRYGRTVAEVYLRGVDLSCDMILTGHARYVHRWDERGNVGRECGNAG